MAQRHCQKNIGQFKRSRETVPNLLPTGSDPHVAPSYEDKMLPTKFQNQLIHPNQAQCFSSLYIIAESEAGYTQKLKYHKKLEE